MKTWLMLAFITVLIVAGPFHAAMAQSGPDLRTAGSFAVLAGTTVTCTTASITGDVGVNLGGSVGACTVAGNVHTGDAVAVLAYNDFLAAYAALTPQPGDACTTVNGTLAGLILPPGVYCIDDSAKTGLLTLNGPPDGNWTFKVGTGGTGALSATSFTVAMPGGAACSNNVIWWTSQSAALTDSTFLGHVFAGTAITVTGGSVEGQLLATTSVTLTSASVCGGGSCTPPGGFNLQSPANGAGGVPTTGVTLDWTDSAGANSYTLYFGTTNPPPAYQTGLTASQFTLPALTQNTPYYWTVVALNGCAPDATTAVDSFTTGTSCIPPGAFTLVAPAVGAVNQSVTGLLLDWTNSAGATSYTLYFGTTNPPPSYQTGLSASQYALPTLGTNTLYYWSVTAANGCAPDATTAAGYFTTSAPCTPPGAFGLTLPAAGAVNQTITNLLLDWTNSAGAATYNLHLGLVNPPPSYQTGLAASQATLQGLAPNTTYYWTVIATNGCAPDATTTVWSFTTGDFCTPPGAFTLVTPAAGAVDQSTTNLLLGWTDSAGAAAYNLYLGTANPPPLFHAGLALSQITVPVLTQNTTYYWYVTAWNSCPTDFTTAVWSFTTGTPCTAPDAPLLVSPTNGATHVSAPVTLAWAAAANATSYEVYVGLHPSTLILIGTTAGLSFTVNDLAQGMTYYWLISAVNTCAIAQSQAWSFTTAGAPAVNYTLFAIAACTSGAANSNWVTDTMIFNDNDHAVNYHLLFTPGGQDGTATPYDFAGTIGPCRSVVNLDILESLYGLCDSAGTLRLVSDEALYFTSRMYNLAETGTYGQFIAALPASSGVGGGTLPAGAMGQILGIQESSAYRTNLGVMEVMGKETTFTFRFYNSAGELLNACCICTVTVQPYSWWQKNLTELGIASGDNLRVEVEVTSGGAVLAYASVVDAQTNDAYFVPAQKVALVTHQLVATVAHAKGGLGTDWRSDLYLYNPSTIAQTATLQFYSIAGPVSNFVEVPAGQNVVVKDIVSQLFSQADGDVAGSLHLNSEAGLLAISRTFNFTENGTYGEFIPALAGADLLAVNETGHILQLSSNADYRCNIGFSEYSGVATQVQLTLFGADCQELGTGTFQVAPYANLQLNGVFQMLNIPGTVDAARAEVKVISGGSIYAYGSVVNNGTGDPIFVPAQK